MFVLLTQKNLQIKTVVNKLEGIDTKFRFFKMEVLAGEDDTFAEVVIETVLFFSGRLVITPLLVAEGERLYVSV